MDIKTRRMDDVIILELHGRLALGVATDDLRDTVADAVAQGDRKLVLNLAGVPSMDSAGLGELVRCSLVVQREKGTIKLANLTSKITDLLAITKLLTVFDTFDSERAAIESLGAQSAVRTAAADRT